MQDCSSTWRLWEFLAAILKGNVMCGRTVQFRWRRRWRNSILKQAGNGNFKEPEQSLIENLDRIQEAEGFGVTLLPGAGLELYTWELTLSWVVSPVCRKKGSERSCEWTEIPFFITLPPNCIKQQDPEFWPALQVKEEMCAAKPSAHLHQWTVPA